MGFKVAPASLHCPQPSVSQFTISSPSSKRRSFVTSDRALFCRYIEQSGLFLGPNQSSKLHSSLSCSNNRSRARIIRWILTASLNSFSDEEFSKNSQELALKFELNGDSLESESGNGEVASNCEAKFMENCKPLDALEPHDRDEIIPANIERKANRVEIPLSLRMIKRKKQWQEGAGELAYCSVKKAFSSMVFIIRELHSYILQMREILFYEDLQGILSNVHGEIHASFVWLFQKVFSQTPTLMVFVMILLANYSVHSVSSTAAIGASPPVQLCTVATEEVSGQSKNKFDSSIVRMLKLTSSSSSGETTSIGGGGGGGGKFRPVASGTHGDGRFDGGLSLLNRSSSGGEESVSRQEEGNDQSEYSRTEILYQTELAQEPNNPLLLANYAQFLYLVAWDFDRAEDYFKRATEVEPRDAEALNKYANFLWVVRNNLWAAEETYLEAISVEPNNSYYAANYAHFLWNTGGEDTCFPLSSPETTTDGGL